MNKQIIFIGNYLPDDEILLEMRNSQAANLFQKKFIDFSKPTLTISILPIFYNKAIKVVSDEKIKFINNQSGIHNKLNYIYRIVFDTIEVLNFLRKRKGNLFFYNIDYQNILIILFLKYFTKKYIYIIVADYDNYEQRLFDKICNKILKNINGVIVLNSNIKCNNRSKLLSGLLYKKDICITNSEILNRNVILSGSLGETTGFRLALDFFSMHPAYQLFITGKPFRYTSTEFNELLTSEIKENKNIHYLGLLEYDDYMKVLEKCDIALSLRNPADKEHDFNFPSKILEYLSKSKMVISTIDYPDLEKGLIFYSEFDCFSLEQTLNKIYNQTSEEIQQRRYKIKEYLENNFTETAINKAICELISQ